MVHKPQKDPQLTVLEEHNDHQDAGGKMNCTLPSRVLK
jgi:hypothetical protein